ncbi:MAG: N-6 DNA methylase [Candidatus Limnocylindrales bacterium]
MISTTAPSRDQQKARGAFYTPPELTRFLAHWAIRSAGERVLEPSCGDGAFLGSISERFVDLGADDLLDRLVGVEREADEADKARALAQGARILTADFFDVETSSLPAVDAVIGNPPYIRYHGFVGEDRRKGLARARGQGVELTRLASSWAHFVVHSVGFLRPEGRLALVLPAELLHADYGQPVRDLLLARFGTVVIVAFDRMVFQDAQVDAVLLLASNDDQRGLRVVRLPDERSLVTVDLDAQASRAIVRPPARWSGSVDFGAGTVYEEALASGVSEPMGWIASVDIGYVSGANAFFVLSREEAASRMLPASVLTPTIRRPADVPGLVAGGEHTRLLLDLAGKPEPTNKRLLAYLADGQAAGIADHYKCRMRRPWYGVPLPRSKPQAFLPYMNHHGPRLIVNDADAWSSNLLHGVTLRPSAPPVRALAVAMCSSLTLLSAEIEGRAYGGGVLKLETKEAERLQVPLLSIQLSKQLVGEFDRINALRATGNLETTASIVDEILALDHARLWSAYLTFRSRRLNRRRALTPLPR